MTYEQIDTALTAIEAHIEHCNATYGYDCPPELLPDFEAVSEALHKRHGELLEMKALGGGK